MTICRIPMSILFMICCCILSLQKIIISVYPIIFIDVLCQILIDISMCLDMTPFLSCPIFNVLLFCGAIIIIAITTTINLRQYCVESALDYIVVIVTIKRTSSEAFMF